MILISTENSNYSVDINKDETPDNIANIRDIFITGYKSIICTNKSKTFIFICYKWHLITSDKKWFKCSISNWKDLLKHTRFKIINNSGKRI
jgi:hypothetical protein